MSFGNQFQLVTIIILSCLAKKKEQYISSSTIAMSFALQREDLLLINKIDIPLVQIEKEKKINEFGKPMSSQSQF